MRIKFSFFTLAFILIFSNLIIAQQNVICISEKEDAAWKSVTGKDFGSASVKNGVITITSDSNLFYVCDKTEGFRNVSVSYNIKSLNEESHTGVLLRYVSPDDWIYVGCDLTSDIFGYSAWYVETPVFRKEIARDIAKLYKNHTRNIRIDCVDDAITLRIDHEIAAQVNIPGIGRQAGRIGFRAHQNGSAIISDIICKELKNILPSTEKKQFNIASKELSVTLSAGFPTPLFYRWNNSQSIIANTQVYDYINLNGDIYQVKASGKKTDEQTVQYLLTVPEVNVKIQVTCRVQGHIFETKITRIDDPGNFKIKTIGFIKQYLAGMENDANNAMLSIAVNEGSDCIFPLATKEHDSINTTASIVILNDDKAAVTLDNNSVYESKQFVYRCNHDVNTTFIGNNEWIYRGIDGKITELPWSKVIFTNDRNDDGKVNWQDGAVALAEVYPQPYGADRMRNSNVTINMNFASEAQYPFLRQLDNIKKTYFLTDGFRQMIELKGYQGEGHDCGHPDYAGHYNVRAGGLKDLQTLVSEGKRYNAYIGLHINESEAHPSAKAYNDKIVTGIPAWKWLDQAYLINKEADVCSGSFQKRLDDLKKDLNGLDFIYIDTYREHRYLAYNTAKIFNEHGWAVWTEDPSVFNRYGVWIHYYPESKSLISRFIHGTSKDAFAADSLFGGGYDRGAAIGFQGWQNGKDMNIALRNFYTIQLPYRYLMQSPVVYADANKLRFKNGMETRRENGVTSMYDNGRLIMKGDVVFIAWKNLTHEKIYHYNPKGGITQWELPATWKSAKYVYCYKLTDTGRTAPVMLPVTDNRISIDAIKDVPYVVYKTKAMGLLPANWSYGSVVKDMGFDSKEFHRWQQTGHTNGVRIETTSYGQSQLKIADKGNAGVTQTITGLKGGKSYGVYVWVQVNGNREAFVEVSGNGISAVRSSISETTFRNTQVNSDKRGSYAQLLRVQFTQPAGITTAQLTLGAASVSDTSFVVFDDIRIIETKKKQKSGYIYFEDFENVEFGWGGWMLSKAGEAKTHLSERHEGHNNDDVISGNWSLKILDQGKGEIIRTMPSLIHFSPNTKYHISFQYRSTTKNSFRVVVRSTKTQKELLSKPLDGEGFFEDTFITDKTDDYYVSIIESDSGMLVIDDFGIR